MFPIRALNEDPEDSCGSGDEEPKVTGEAEETIVVSEYLRALNCISSNQQNSALLLFLELLQTEVLNKVSNDAKDNKLLLVKYNCFRNIGLLYQEKGKDNLALDYLIRAVELCNNDVHTMYILAQLALKIGQISVAKAYYEKCIERNANHWPSLDGILVLFLVSGKIIEACCWAIRCFKKDNKYKRAVNVLHEINNRFSSSIPFIEELLQKSSQVSTFAASKCMPPLASCFHNYHDNSCTESRSCAQVDINYELLKVRQLSWITLGQWIIQMHQHLESIGQVMYHFNLNKFLGIQANIDEYDNKLDEPIHIPEDDPVPEVTDNRNTKNADLLIDLETKSRRRGSELKILEQWGWHKSRRSSRKKSTYESSDPVESTADEFLKRVLGQYFVKTYEENKSPFSDQPYGHKNENFKHKKYAAPSTMRHFIKHSTISFHGMIAEIEHREIDSYLLIYTYLLNLSLYWNEPMPQELCTLYIQVYGIFATYNNYQSWNQLTNDEITGLFRMAILYLELFHDNTEGKLLRFGESEDNRLFKNIANDLQLYVSYLTEENFIMYQSRYLWLNYAVSMHENDIDAALRKLTQVNSLLEEQPNTFEVCLPNQQYNNVYNKRMIQEMIESLQRQINLRNVKELYAAKNYHTLVNILKDSLTHTTLVQSNTNQTLSISTQIEILLECFWHLEQYLDCIVWAEKSLKYTVDVFVSLQNVPYRQKNWTKAINFILLYIQSLIEKEGDYIMTFEFIPRMVQTIHKILNNQLDSHYDKHLCNQYIIDCWRAWVILYYVLERQDDQNMMYRKNRGVNQEMPLHEIEEESLFSSIMLFFVAHELLGRRQWCSKGNNRLLLKMLDVIVPKLRSPMFEPYRDIISECLEQTTFCLFGYPPKKGRTRHLQDHESTMEILSWERAVQLFDIYRPDVLPEFNSYKIDSISADMEALLQQILLIMPEDCDVSLYIEPIMDFINGKGNNIPKITRKDVLCFKIRPIYYFLADFYFKSRDFSKAIKYYVLDLTVEPARFDSWAGISLSKASKCETTLNSAEALSYSLFLHETNNTMRCFEQSLILNEHDPQLWVEYGSFAYNVSSYCARTIKSSVKSSYSYLTSQQVYYMNIAHKSFERVNAETNVDQKEEHHYRGNNEDEKWLYHYMLGKIAEKRKDQPMVYLAHYLKAAKCLYECNATYPIKVNHSNPSQLSIEALELFYRANAAIIKYTEKHSSIGKHEAGLFKKILKELAVSPFAVNRAKISDVTFKRKLVGSSDKIQNVIPNTSTKIGSSEEFSRSDEKCYFTSDDDKLQTIHNITENRIIESYSDKKQECVSRRISQESIPATNTTTTTTSNATSSSGTDSPSTDSDSDSSTDDEISNSSADRDTIFKDCVKNMEECVTRFPEHYKSIYRLAYHYMNAPGATKSLEKCSQLLLGSYKTTLGNQIPGLFTERRSNNFFNGIWRIPSSDIDRPGSFSSHLSKCVTILIETLKQKMDHETLLELAIQLYRRPDTDK
ncbi:calcineurin-binding protein cabin-1-like isoform X2 [Ochlerotatus camptorhynchus]